MLSWYLAAVFVLFAGGIFASPFAGDPDEDQALIDRLDDFVENVHNHVIESTGYERLRVVVNSSKDALEFFQFIGYLLLNGTLGQCVYDAWIPPGRYCTIHISPNRSRFGDAMADFLAEGRETNLEDIENFPLVILPEWELAWEANINRSQYYLKALFSDTWNFFDILQGHIAEAHAVYVGIGWFSELPWKCSWFSADLTDPLNDNTIKARTIAHDICLSINDYGKHVNATEADRRREWTMENLASIGEWLLVVDSVLAETPPPYWIVEAKGVMENVIGNETVPYPSPTDAVHLYKRIHDRFQSDVRSISALHIKNLSDSQIDVLVYYPAYDSTEHCYRNLTDVILSGQFSGVNYVVSLRQGPVPSWITSENATMERHFGQVKSLDSEKSDQCERIGDVDRKMKNKLFEGLRAIVAVKCARRFVWYELGYQYFPAAYTEAPTVRIKQASTYNSNCGMLVLFP